MKPENVHTIKYQVYRRLFYFQAFFYIFSTTYSQQPDGLDQVRKDHDSITALETGNINLSLSGTDFSGLSELISPAGSDNQKTLIFLDSLKRRASKKLITRKLYDFVIIPHEPQSTKEITGSSDVSFIDYSGLKIRRIEIKRLNVFGSNISTPDFNDPNKTEKLLNKTHFNTNEIIIRKNLLFREVIPYHPLTSVITRGT